MPWIEVRPMDAKVLFISDWIRGHTGFSELCEKHGISRKTGYKWVGRYRDTGIDGLQDKSRRPGHSPNQVPYTIQKEILAVRKKHKSWGARNINKILENRHSDWDIPSSQTIHKILKGADQPNDLWTVDFKGRFRTWDRVYCYPLTVMDQACRYLLGCDGFPGTRYKETRESFERLFREYGLPERIRSDKGVPFASRSIGGLSKLGVWWVSTGDHTGEDRAW